MSVSCGTYRRELHLRPATQGSGRKAACEEGTTADEERMCSKKKSNGSRVEGSGAYVEGEEFRCLVGAGAEVDGDDLEVEALLVEHGGHAHHVGRQRHPVQLPRRHGSSLSFAGEGRQGRAILGKGVARVHTAMNGLMDGWTDGGRKKARALLL